MSVASDNVSIDKKFKEERAKLMSLIYEVEADNAPHIMSHSGEEQVANENIISGSRSMKRRSIFGDQTLEAVPDRSNNPLNMFDSLHNPILEQLTIDLTSQITRQQHTIDALHDRVKSAESHMKTASSWRNTTTSYCSLLLNELGSKNMDRNVLEKLCICLSEHMGIPPIAIGAAKLTEHSEPEPELATETIDPQHKVSIKNVFTITSADIEEKMYHIFSFFTSRMELFKDIDRESCPNSTLPATLLSRKGFFLLCFSLSLFNRRVSMNKVHTVFDRCVLHESKSTRTFSSRLNYHGFCNAIAHMSMLHHDEANNQVLSQSHQEGAFAYSTNNQSKLGEYVNLMWGALTALSEDADKFQLVVGLFGPLAEPKVFSSLMLYQDLLLKEFKVRTNYLVVTGGKDGGYGSEHSSSNNNTRCRSSTSPTKAAAANERDEISGMMGYSSGSSSGICDRTSSNVLLPSTSKRIHDVSKMHVESGFEQLCVDAKIVPKLVRKFATIRRISLFLRALPKELSASYFFACFSCLLTNIVENNQECSASAALGARKPNVDVFMAVMMQVIALIESATLGERDHLSFLA